MKKEYPGYILLCAIGIAINFAGAVIDTKLNPPLYLDAIGTVGVAAVGGLLSGITVGFLTNMLNSVTDALISTITEELKAEGKLSIPSLGTFELREHVARTGKNPRTGEKVEISAKKVPAFKAAKALKDAVE